jgi:SAM-dependent methyltransferase
MIPSEALTKHGSDKVTDHSYGPVYDALLAPDRLRVCTLLEIGVLEGASLRAWADAFPSAIVFGIDINLPPDRVVGERCRVTQADAADPLSVARALSMLGIGPLSLDVVIDDASHKFRDQIAAFLLLWDYIRPGGIYVIEDIHPNSPHALYARLGGAVHDVRHIRGRIDDVLVIFHKPA